MAEWLEYQKVIFPSFLAILRVHLPLFEWKRRRRGGGRGVAWSYVQVFILTGRSLVFFSAVILRHFSFASSHHAVLKTKETDCCFSSERYCGRTASLRLIEWAYGYNIRWIRNKNACLVVSWLLVLLLFFCMYGCVGLRCKAMEWCGECDTHSGFHQAAPFWISTKAKCVIELFILCSYID